MVLTIHQWIEFSVNFVDGEVKILRRNVMFVGGEVNAAAKSIFAEDNPQRRAVDRYF